MGKIGPQHFDAKSQLVLEICAISTAPVGCIHRRHCIPAKSHFVDWYHLLGVAEDAGMEAIKKRYHTLALQLHPDKNKHPKAETAFKLVLEAYSCLSDGVRRRTFNSERCKSFCIECNGIPYESSYSSINSCASKVEEMDSRSCRVARVFKDIRDRFKEETRVIENCLRANSLSRKESQLFTPATSNSLVDGRSTHMTQKESPVFDPSDYLFHGYPHLRRQVYKKPENFCHFQRGSILNYGRERYQSPIFETVPERRMFKSKSVCIRS
ncbi:hypothetical protein SLEP1_g42 [Rubroshorea leprosula]|uniref:J domain-containing protein n=1 Tax=Rubroshorea leprosula TaxID=152421 RepID=A0AAV5HI18_9ROSI|nr:hypothetical protein SLEP1_g42 [Rubroshorea leprosula]